MAKTPIPVGAARPLSTNRRMPWWKVTGVVLAAVMFLVVACQRDTDKSSTNAPFGRLTSALSTTADYWPTAQWREATPESHGFSSEAFAAMLDRIQQLRPSIHSLLVIRGDAIILDANFYPFPGGTRHDIASITKSVTSLLVGVAVREGKLTIDQPILSLISERPSQPDARKGRITLSALLAMRSGLDCGFHGETELERMVQTKNWVQAAVDLPMRDEPGSRMAYCSPNYHLLSKAVQNVTGMSLSAFAEQSLFRRLGITDYVWPADPTGVTHGWGDLQLKTRDLAKIGYLVEHDGFWEGTRILPEGWIARTTKPASRFNATDWYGLGWWTHVGSPLGFFEAIGRGGQRLSIWPAKNLVVVFTGGGFEPGDIAPLLLAAYKADTALAANPLGVKQLQAALSTAARAPASEVFRRPPEAAQRASGHRFEFPPNEFHLRWLTFFFDSGAERLRMNLDGRQLELPIGFDGRYRISADSIDGIPPGARGVFRGDDELALDLNLIGKINRYELTARFLGTRLRVDVREFTGPFRATVLGHLQD